MADEALPEHIIRDLTANIPQAEGGSRANGQPITPENPIWYPLRPRQDGTTTVVYYSFEAKEPRHDYHAEAGTQNAPKAVNPRKFNAWEEDVARETMNAIQNVGDVVFLEAGKPYPNYPEAAHIKPEDADLCFFASNKLWGGEALGYAEGMEKKDGPRDVLMAPHGMFRMIIFHEISHAVAAISHINARGLSVMVPEADKAFRDEPVNFGSFDAIWQRIYGKSKQDAVRNTTVGFEELAVTPLLYREGEVTLDLSGLNVKERDSSARIDLAQEFGRQISAPVMANGQLRHINTSLAPGTRIKDLVFLKNGDDAPPVYARGNGLPNRLEGGGSEDILWARDGRDMLTGREGADIFRFDALSGSGNVITDQQPHDSIQFHIPLIERVSMRWRDNAAGEEADPKKPGGTEVTVSDHTGATTSVFVSGRTPEEIQGRLFQVSRIDVNGIGDKGVETKLDAIIEVPAASGGQLRPGATPVPEGAVLSKKSTKR